MTKRIIEIGREGCTVKVRYQQLVLKRDGEQIGSLPIEDLSAVILDHPQIVISKACLEALLSHNVVVVTTDIKHMPVGLLLPLDAHGVQTERLNAQALLNQPLKKQLWKQLIQAKITMQAKVLKDVTGNDRGISQMVKKVRSGDPENIEAQAARRYWAKLFDNFKRDRDAEDQNRYLNYGYAILRALVCRSLCASGLHPGLGLHHHNRYNAYPLADDVMEPFRAIVDLHVHELLNEYHKEEEMTQELRGRLLAIIEFKLNVAGEQITLQNAILRACQSLANIIMGDGKMLLLPTTHAR